MLWSDRIDSKLRNIRQKIISKTLSFGASTILITGSMGGALPMILTGTAYADGTIDISSVSDLRNAIEHQADGQTWTIEPGVYDLAPFNNTTAGCPTSCQTGWYFPIVANNITINGIGNPTIYSTSYTANGAWSTQDLMAIFGNNVTINGLTLMPKVEANKTIEVIGDNTTIENTVIKPNTLVNPSEFSHLSDPTEAQWGGSIYYNGAGGAQTLNNVTIDNGGISYHASAAGVQLAFNDVTLNYATNVDWINSYRYSKHFNNPTGSTVRGTPQVIYHVNNTLNNLSDVLANVQGSDVVDLDSNLTTTQQITLSSPITLNGNGHTLSPSFANTSNANNSALGIQASNVTVNNLIENGMGGVNLHGINVYDANHVILNNVTVENNSHTGLNVDGANVTVNNLTTANNGWDGADVDKPGAILTVNGISHQTEVSPDIYVDNSSVGKVVDTNHQYSFANNVFRAGDRVYSLNPTAPTNGQPNGGFEKTNNFYFTWDTSSGNSPLTYEFQTSMNPTNTNGILTTGVWDNIANGNNEQKSLTSPEIHSVGAPDGTWYWQVRAIDVHGDKSAWSPIWSVTIDTHAPTGLSNVSPANNTRTTTQNLTQIDWTVATDAYGPVTYFYESSHSPATNPNGSFTAPAYRSGPLNTNHISTLGTPAGTYYWHVRAVDAAGNSTPWTNAWKITVDNNVPVAPINLQAKYQYDKTYLSNGSTIWALSKPGPYKGDNLELTWNDKLGDWVTGHHLLVTWPDGTTHTVYQGPNTNNWLVSQDGFGAHGEGKYSFQVIATNPNGPSATSDEFSLYYVNHIPIATFTAQPPKFVNGNFQVNIAAKDDVVLQNVFVDVRSLTSPNKGSWVAGCVTDSMNPSLLPVYSDNGSGVTVTYTCTVNTHDLVSGTTYMLRANASDSTGHGNVNSGKYWEFTFDNTSPVTPTALLYDSDSRSVTDGYINTQHFTFKLSDTSNDVTRYQLKYWNTIPGSLFNGENHAWNPTDLSSYSSSLDIYNDQFTQGEGTHYFAFSACDAAGNCSPYSTPFVVTYDKTPPTVAIVSPTDFSKPFPNGPTVTVNATDFGSGLQSLITDIYDGSNILLPMCGGATAAELSSGSMVCDLSSLPNGTYSIRASAVDKAGNSTVLPYITFTVAKTTMPIMDTFATTHPSSVGSNSSTPNTSASKPVTPPMPGASTNNSDTQSSSKGYVKGDHTNVPNVNINAASSTKPTNNILSFLGIAWYWWLAAVIAFLTLIYYVYRRSSTDDVKGAK